MRTSLLRSGCALAAVLVVLACDAGRSAEREATRPTERARRQFERADPPLDSSSVRIRVVDFESGEGVRALACIYQPQDTTVVIADGKYVVVSGLGPANVWMRVVARGYEPERLILMPSKPGRSQVVVRMVRGGTASEEPGCGSGYFDET